jgi:type VI protein secretion system component VasK
MTPDKIRAVAQLWALALALSALLVAAGQRWPATPEIRPALVVALLLLPSLLLGLLLLVRWRLPGQGTESGDCEHSELL